MSDNFICFVFLQLPVQLVVMLSPYYYQYACFNEIAIIGYS